MKKFIKRVVVTLVVFFAFLGASVTALAASGYIQWPGSGSYDTTMTILENIKITAKTIKEERDTFGRENEQLVNTIKDKDNTIDSSNQQLKAKDKEIENKQKELEQKQKELEKLQNSAINNSDQLKQAEKDMKSTEQKAREVLESIK